MKTSTEKQSLLFIRRRHRGNSIDHWLYHAYRDLYRYYKPGGHFWRFKGQNGFFKAALHTVYNVNIVTLPGYFDMEEEKLDNYTAVVIDLKAFNFDDKLKDRVIEAVSERDSHVHVLFVSNDVAQVIPGDEVLDPFQLIFKREPLRDREQYDISFRNKKKIEPTMLGCPMIKATPWNIDDLKPAELGSENYSEEFEHDVFFAGINTSRRREKVVKLLREEIPGFYGGLQFRKQEPEIDKKYGMKRLGSDEFQRKMRRSRINLAIEGEGEFTFRHNETWFLSGFLLASHLIRNIELPMNMEEGKDYVCFENQEDLLGKIEHYLDRPGERRRIAESGRKTFEKDFDYHKHGEFIRGAINRV